MVSIQIESNMKKHIDQIVVNEINRHSNSIGEFVNGYGTCASALSVQREPTTSNVTDYIPPANPCQPRCDLGLVVRHVSSELRDEKYLHKIWLFFISRFPSFLITFHSFQ